jgi:hypothetical protein
VGCRARGTGLRRRGCLRPNAPDLGVLPREVLARRDLLLSGDGPAGFRGGRPARL